MQDLLCKQLSDALSALSDEMIAKLTRSFDIELVEDIEDGRYYVEKQIAEAIIENEVVGVTLLRIREELEGSQASIPFKNALTDSLLIRINRAAETASSSSTY